MTDAQAREFVFKAALRDYFYSSADVMKSFFVPTKEQLQNEDYDITAVKINMAAREKAFNVFYNRVIHSVIFKDDGTLYSSENRLQQITDDFISGKPVIFRGTDNEGLVELKAGNPTHAQRAFLRVNNARSTDNLLKTYSELTGNEHCSIKINHDPSSGQVNSKFKPENMDHNPPSGGGWWNKIVKKFTGHPSKRWEKYENYQRKVTIDRAKDLALLQSNETKELDPNNVKTYQEEAVRDYSKGKTIAEAQKNFDEFAKSLKEVEDAFRYDPETKSYKKLRTEEAQERKAQKAKEKAEQQKAKENYAPKKNEVKETERKAPPKPKEKTLSEKRYASMVVMLGTKTMDKIRDAKAADVERPFKSAMENLISLGNPDAPKISAEQIAESLTTVYMIGEMMASAADGYSRYGSEGANEFLFGALADEILGKSKEKPITSEITKRFIDSGLAQDLLDNPTKIDEIIFNPKDAKPKDLERNPLHVLVEKVKFNLKTERFIDQECDNNKQKNMGKNIEVEKQGSLLSF